MSHLVSIQTRVRDQSAVAAACRRLQLPKPTQGTAQLYNGSATGLIVRFPGWTYPAVADLATGQLHFDHYEGRWGDPTWIHRLLQAYAIEKTRLEARRQGHDLREQLLADGSVKLTIHVGGSR